MTEDVVTLHPIVAEPTGHPSIDKIELAIIVWLLMHTERREEHQDRSTAPLQIALGLAQARLILLQEHGLPGGQDHYAGYVGALATVIGRLSERQRAKLRHVSLGRDSAQRIMKGESL